MNSNGNVSVSEPNEKIIQNKHNDYDSKEEKIMPLVTSKEMLLKAQKGGYAVGAFNAENMEMVKAIIQAAEELKAPVMIQTTPSTVKYGTVDTYAAIVAAEAKKASVPVCLHLDHGSSFELAMQAIHAGYTSVMIDGSKLDFEANIAETKRVADVANALDIPCEAELGKVGGKEDDLEAEADTNTDPQEAKEFVERTGVTSLAVAIGTAHGFYVGTPVLDKERLSEIREVVNIPLIIKGGERGKVVTAPASHIDIAPTVMDYFGLHIPKLLEGKSMLPQIYDTTIKINSEVYTEFTRYEIDHDGFGGLQIMRGVISENYKLAINLLDRDEFYDLKKDPDEMVNEIDNPEYLEIILEYHRKLVTHMNATRDLYRGYQWSLRPWNKNFTPSWDNEGFTRQRENEEYEPRQLDYDTGLPIKEAVRSKYLYEMGGEQ